MLGCKPVVMNIPSTQLNRVLVSFMNTPKWGEVRRAHLISSNTGESAGTRMCARMVMGKVRLYFRPACRVPFGDSRFPISNFGVCVFGYIPSFTVTESVTFTVSLSATGTQHSGLPRHASLAGARGV